MRTSDFTSKPTAKVMNETLNKKFGEKLDLDNYSPEQLKKAASLIENKIAVLKRGYFFIVAYKRMIIFISRRNSYSCRCFSGMAQHYIGIKFFNFFPK